QEWWEIRDRKCAFTTSLRTRTVKRTFAISKSNCLKQVPTRRRQRGLGQVNSAGRDVAEYNLERKRTSSTSSAGLLKRRAVDTYPRYGWARPGHACLWTNILNPL